MHKTTAFQEKVYKECKKVPKGKVTTYNAIAKKLHTSPRAVGQALKVNPYAPRVPCHRVVKSDGQIGGYSGSDPKNINKKMKLLKKEGIKIKNKQITSASFCSS